MYGLVLLLLFQSTGISCISDTVDAKWQYIYQLHNAIKNEIGVNRGKYITPKIHFLHNKLFYFQIKHTFLS